MQSGALLLLSSVPLFAQVIPVKNLPLDSKHAVTSESAQKQEVSIAPPSHPATAAQIREYLAVTHANENAHKLMEQSVAAMRTTGNPAIPPAMWDDMSEEFKKFDLITPMIPAYQRYLSEEDMATIIAFYRTEAGQRILASQPYIVSSSQESLRKMGEEIGRKVGERHKDELEARQKQLDEEAAARANGGAAKPQIVIPPEGKK